MPTTTDYYILTSRITYSGNKEKIILTHITEEEEAVLDSGENLEIVRGVRKFNIHANNIYCYGDIDLREGSDDSKEIATFDFLDYLNGVGIKIPSDYNYENHECHSPIDRYRITETWRPEVLTRYAHGCLGKPKKILLFIETR